MNNCIKVLFILIFVSTHGYVFAAEKVEGWAAADMPVVINGGTIIDVRDGSLIENSVIIVNGDNIESITQNSATRIPPDAIVLDARGKYILPGFLDIHVHYKDWAAQLYLNHGVTTVTSLGDTYEWIRSQKIGIKSGAVYGPRLYHSTENIDHTPESENYYLKFFTRIVNDPEDASEAMIQYINDGVDAVKTEYKLTDEELVAIIEEAKKADIPVLGHFRNVYVAAKVGANGVEHTGAVANVMIDENAREIAYRKIRKGLDMPAESFMDVSKIPEVVQLMVENNLYLNPTIRMGWQGDKTLRQKGFHIEDFELFNNWDLRFVPINWVLANYKEYQEVGLWNWRDLTEFELEVYHNGFQNMQSLVKAFSEAGGKLYAGTDSSNMAVPGLATHQELELMVNAGVSELAALQSATINSAELMRMEERLGLIEEGMAGDLIILEDNPLKDIKNTRKIWRVISRGEVLDGKYDPTIQNLFPKSTPESSSHYFPSPRLDSLSPKSFVQGNYEETLSIKGTGFIPYSLVTWNGKILETEFVSKFELKALVPRELMIDIGTFTVRVENPDFGWGTVKADGASASNIADLGIRDYVSNEGKVIILQKREK